MEWIKKRKKRGQTASERVKFKLPGEGVSLSDLYRVSELCLSFPTKEWVWASRTEWVRVIEGVAEKPKPRDTVHKTGWPHLKVMPHTFDKEIWGLEYVFCFNFGEWMKEQAELSHNPTGGLTYTLLYAWGQDCETMLRCQKFCWVCGCKSRIVIRNYESPCLKTGKSMVMYGWPKKKEIIGVSLCDTGWDHGEARNKTCLL